MSDENKTTPRNPSAVALEEFINSPEGQKLCNPATLRAPADQSWYLKNRIEAAFLAGMEAEEKLTGIKSHD